MKKITSTNLTGFKALDQTPPEEDAGVGPDARATALTLATITNPTMLLMWIKENPTLAIGGIAVAGGAVGAGIAAPRIAKTTFNVSKLLLKVGTTALRKLVFGKNEKEAAEYLVKLMKTKIFNEYNGWYQKLKNTRLLNKDMRFLCLGLEQKGLITKIERDEFLKVIESGGLNKSIIRPESEARKALKDFAMAFAHKGLISVNTLKSVANLSVDDLKALQQARIKTKTALGITTTAADQAKPKKTFPKYKTLPKMKSRVRF